MLSSNVSSISGVCLGLALVLGFTSPITGFPSRDVQPAGGAFEWLQDSDTWGSSDPASIIFQDNYTECGGLVAVNTTLNLITYTPAGGMPVAHRCFWTLDSNYSEIEVYIDFIRMSYDSGLSIVYFPSNQATEFTIYKVPPVAQSELQFRFYDKAYIVLSTNQAGGDGFRLGFRGNTAAFKPVGYHQHITAASGGLRSHNGQYLDNERTTILLQTPNNCTSTVRVTTLDTEENLDILRVYRFAPFWTDVAAIGPFTNFSGYHPFGPPNSTLTTTEALIFTFWSDSSDTKTGFTLDWNCN